MTEPELIEKEEVGKFHFLTVSPEESQVTREKLERALRLGNEYKGKTKISFLTDFGPKMIETTVWTLGTDYIQIKKMVEIPISSLIDLRWD